MITDEQLKRLRSETPPWEPRKVPATEPQQRYIAQLIQEREVPEAWLLNIKRHVEDDTLTKHKATSIISDLKKLPWKPKEALNKQDASNVGFSMIPAGYYALPIPDAKDGENDIVFYRVWKPKDNENRGNVYILRGPDDLPLLTYKAALGIITKIRRYGIGKAAELYGVKTGRCSQCNRRLTNRISRELKIGPKCGGRVHGEGWHERVNSAREAIRARGEDPDEKIE